MLNLFKDYKNFPKNSGIYKITTIHNNEIYIGSALSLKKRMKDHINDFRGNRHGSHYMQNVYNKHGEIDFIVEFLYISPNIYKLNSLKHRQLIVLEEVFINKLNANYNVIKTPTTQINNPSTSKIVYQYTMNGEFIREWDSSMEVKRILNIQPQNSLRGLNRSSGGFRWTNIKYDKLPLYKANQGSYGAKKISVYDIWGVKLKTFNSVTDCAKNIFPNEDLHNIRQSIEKYTKSTKVFKNYRFSFGDFNKIDNSINLTHKKDFIILQYDNSMNFIKIWSCISEAQKALNITSIYDNLSGKIKMSGGFIWKKLS